MLLTLQGPGFCQLGNGIVVEMFQEIRPSDNYCPAAAACTLAGLKGSAELTTPRLTCCAAPFVSTGVNCIYQVLKIYIYIAAVVLSLQLEIKLVKILPS